MALGAYLYEDIFTQGGPGLDNISATTSCLDGPIIRMDVGFHVMSYRLLSLQWLLVEALKLCFNDCCSGCTPSEGVHSNREQIRRKR